jgi:hypothetical protein
VRTNALRKFLVWSLTAFAWVGSSLLLSSDGPTNIKVLTERVQRVSRDEVHLWVKVVIRSDRPVFLTGISHKRPYPLFLEHWRAEEGWKVVAPCDLVSPGVISLNPREAITLYFALKLPRLDCKGRAIQFEGRFRHRLDYFESEKEARTYAKVMESPAGEEAAPRVVVVSEPFEIPPPSK